MKIIINECYGGFSVTKEVFDELGIKWDNCGLLSNEDFEIDGYHYEYRKNEKLIAAIEKVGLEKASGLCLKLKIVEIPDDVEWEINEYDGIESVHEVHR